MTVAIDVSPACGAWTGVGRYVLDLVNGLVAAERKVLCVHQGHRGAVDSGLATTSRRYDLITGRIGLRFKLPRILTRQGVQVYHATSTIGVPAVSWRGAIVVTIHDCYPLRAGAALPPGQQRRFRTLLAECLRHAHHIITPSTISAQEVRGAGWRGDLSVIPHGIAAPPVTSRPPEAPPAYMVSIGAIEPRKGLHLLSGPLPLPWFHLGGVRHDPDHAIRRAMIAAGCQLMGHVSESRRLAWLAHASCLVQPSVHEGFGYPVLEAAAAGVPVIARPIPAVLEILGPTGAQWVHQDADWSRGISAGCSDANRLCAAGRERALAHTIPQMVAAHAAAYDRVLVSRDTLPCG